METFCFGAGSGVEAPVDGVEEQVGQREGEAGVRVDHVAVADQQVHVFTHRPLPAEAGPLRGPDVRGLGRRGEGVGGQGGWHAGEWSQLHVVVVETAVEGHRLAGVEGGRDLKREAFRSRSRSTICTHPQMKSGFFVFKVAVINIFILTRDQMVIFNTQGSLNSFFWKHNPFFVLCYFMFISIVAAIWTDHCLF